MPAEQPGRIFATAPTPIVVFENHPYDEPIYKTTVGPDGKSDGIRREVGRNKGEALHVRGVLAHIQGQTAHPLDGGDPLPFGPGKPGHWGRKAHGY